MISEQIEKSAERLLEDLNVKDISIPVEDIAGRLGMKISRAPSKQFSGLLIRKDGKALVGINSGEAPVRQRFTIAHEIGHFLLHPQKDTFVDYRGHKQETRTPKEREADMFAAALLMPRHKIARDFKNFVKGGLEIDEIKLILADRYEVSEDAMGYRLINLGLYLAI